ncbi:Aluminum-activated malate transporter 9 [Dichanthelium oligosanthes]|uniref:Aluminum-activated malate transporter 9 n=1 Tax=Dichanthelium oligosanthes TaxID=888268 RepID=A0A1E5V959_9POAL|nr:Aluminum-activated malate transporter 9 [Dichanthelium oligosanthes]
MNGKKGSIRIDICLPSNNVVPEGVKKPSTKKVPAPRKWLRDLWEFARQDTNRVTFALKVGLACLLVLLVSLLILFRAPYDIFGTNIIWSILTVAIMFEYTVGATFNRGFNRALGSVLAGVFAIVVIQVAISSGHIAEPYIIGFSIFLIGAVTSFMKLWPSLVPYEHGFRVILFTYCLLIVSGYRMGNPMRTAMDRLYSIAIGGLATVLVNAFICPIWAGEQLHKELVNNFNSLADSLEDCVKKYQSDDGSEHPDFSKTVMEDFPDEPAFKKYRTTLNSSAKLDSLAPYNLRCAFRSEILDATNQAAELLHSLAKDVDNMKWSLQTSLLKHVHVSTERLQHSIDLHSYLFTASHEDNSAKAQLKTTRFVSFNLKDFTKEYLTSQKARSPETQLPHQYQCKLNPTMK